MTLPAPYYSDASVTLYHGDCLALLPHVGAVDHVITDPPYEAEAHTKAKRQSKGPDTLAEVYEIDFAAIDETTRSAVGREFARAANGWILAFCQAEGIERWRAALEAGGAKWRRTQFWYKPDGAPCFMGDRPAQACECIATAWAGQGRSKWAGGGQRGFYSYCVNDYGRLTSGRPHPTMKPVSLMRELVHLFTYEGQTILDPFAGSGTTGLAARLEGRRAILIEREERYCEVAAKRLSHMPSETAAGQLALLGGGR